MTPRLIRDLLEIAREANRHPRLKHLRDAALAELTAATLNTVEQIVPVLLVKDRADEAAKSLIEEVHHNDDEQRSTLPS